MKKLVRENMSSHLITIGWEESLETAFRRMQERRIRHLPVHNEAGEILGIISDRDVNRAMISTIKSDDSRSNFALPDETIEFSRDARVKDYMSWPVKTVTHDTDLKRVAQRMVQEKISSIMVQKEGSVVGIVTVEDMLKVLIELLSEPQGPVRWTLETLLGDSFGKLNHTLI